VGEPTATVLVPMRDGTRLATDVYLPDRPGRLPAVLARTPYGARGNAVWFPAIGRLFADNGLAFVAQDTRGHYASEGIAAPFECEASDGYDTCEWIVQEPWSDGTLAVFGESYVGYTALDTVASAVFGWSSGSGGRWRPGPGATASRRTSTGRSVHSAPSCPPLLLIVFRLSSMPGPAAKGRAVRGAQTPTGRRSSTSCMCRRTSRPAGGISSAAASYGTGSVTSDGDTT
jgi:hypothetical protein